MTAYIKQDFHFILGLLEVVVTNYVLNHLGSQSLDMGVFIVPLSCYLLVSTRTKTWMMKK